ncbi:MAG TPA: YdeI/OmpD-associated family protein [Ktedonobacterales bacterium]|nr:YdeI/OmpD-associated family protein [Ktedonobacterales bacterium]
MTPAPRDQYAHITPRDRAEWRAWLTANHAEAPGVWLVYYKKGSGLVSVSYDEAVEEALCFGWIDSAMRRLDDARYEQVFTPRKRRSPWSQSNKERVARLMAQGLMAPAGLAAVEAARRDGAWAMFDGIENLETPDDVAAALAEHPTAAANFAAFSNAVRQQSLWWIADAKRPETRQRRIARVVEAAAQNHNPRADAPRERR